MSFEIASIFLRGENLPPPAGVWLRPWRQAARANDKPIKLIRLQIYNVTRALI